jgi:hypothetical protein
MMHAPDSLVPSNSDTVFKSTEAPVTSSASSSTPWSSFSQKQEDLLLKLKQSRAEDVKIKTHLAEVVRSSLEECLAENDSLMASITHIVEEGKFMEHRYKTLETEVIQLRAGKDPAVQREIVDITVSNLQRVMSRKHTKLEQAWKEERKDLKEQVECQQQEIKQLRGRIRLMKKNAKSVCSSAEYVFSSLGESLEIETSSPRTGGSRRQSGSDAHDVLCDQVETEKEMAEKEELLAPKRRRQNRSVANVRQNKQVGDTRQTVQRTWQGGLADRDHPHNILEMPDALNAKALTKKPPGKNSSRKESNIDMKSDIELFLEVLLPAETDDNKLPPGSKTLSSAQEKMSDKEKRFKKCSRLSSSVASRADERGQILLQRTWHGRGAADRGSLHKSRDRQCTGAVNTKVETPQILASINKNEEKHKADHETVSTAQESVPPKINELDVALTAIIRQEGQNRRRRTLPKDLDESDSAPLTAGLHETWHGGSTDRTRVNMLLGSRRSSQEFDKYLALAGKEFVNEDEKMLSLVQHVKIGQSLSAISDGGKECYKNLLATESSAKENAALVLEDEEALFSKSGPIIGEIEGFDALEKNSRTGRNLSRSGILKKHKLLSRLARQKKVTAELT